jgi:hypothetical protein
MRSVLLLVTCLLGAGPAHAAPVGQGERDKLIEAANRAKAEGRFDESRQLWRVLWGAEGEPLAACNIGQLSSRMGDPVTAFEFLTICVERNPGVPAHKLELSRAEARVGRLRIRAPKGARLFLDGKTLSASAAPVVVKPGAHEVEADLGGQRGKKVVLVEAGETQEVAVELPALRHSPPARSAAKGPTWPIYAGLAVSGLGVVTGATLLAVAYRERDWANSRAQAINPGGGCVAKSPECDEVRASAARFFDLRTAAIGVFIGAGALGAGTAVYAVLRPSGAGLGGSW